MRKNLARFIKNEDGAALVEYGLLVGLIAVVSIGVVTVLGDQIHNLFCLVVTDLQIPGVTSGGTCAALTATAVG